MKPLVVAEISGNHNGSLERALKIVEAAASAGAHAVKIQTYTADTMTLPGFKAQGSAWAGRDLHDLYREAHTPWEWHWAIFEHCRKYGMLGFSSPFDASAVDFLETLDVPFYKIASFELTDTPLIRKVAETGKPILMSTGMATESEIEDAIQASKGCPHLTLLKCTSAYPANASGCNLKTIADMRERFGLDVGLSDHTPGTAVAVAAVALGACVIEKHLTLSRADGGVDSGFSMEPDEFRRLVADVNAAYMAMGSVEYGPTAQERESLQFRRSLYVTKDMNVGDELTAENMRSLRPSANSGLSPKLFDELIGKRVFRKVKAGTPLTRELLRA